MTKPKKTNYADLSAELDEVMTLLEGGELSLDEAVACYERGLGIIKTLEKHLLHAENRVSELKSQLEADEEE